MNFYIFFVNWFYIKSDFWFKFFYFCFLFFATTLFLSRFLLVVLIILITSIFYWCMLWLFFLFSLALLSFQERLSLKVFFYNCFLILKMPHLFNLFVIQTYFVDFLCVRYYHCFCLLNINFYIYFFNVFLLYYETEFSFVFAFKVYYLRISILSVLFDSFSSVSFFIFFGFFQCLIVVNRSGLICIFVLRLFYFIFFNYSLFVLCLNFFDNVFINPSL